jgi:hypothetical protein
MGIPREGTVTFLKELLGKPCCYFAVQPTLEVAIKLTHIWQIVIFSWRSLVRTYRKTFSTAFFRKQMGHLKYIPKARRALAGHFAAK